MKCWSAARREGRHPECECQDGLAITGVVFVAQNSRKQRDCPLAVIALSRRGPTVAARHAKQAIVRATVVFRSLHGRLTSRIGSRFQGVNFVQSGGRHATRRYPAVANFRLAISAQVGNAKRISHQRVTSCCWDVSGRACTCATVPRRASCGLFRPSGGGAADTTCPVAAVCGAPGTSSRGQTRHRRAGCSSPTRDTAPS